MDGVSGKMELRDGGRMGEGKQTSHHPLRPSIVAGSSSPPKGRCAFLLPVMTEETEGQRRRKKAGEERKNSKDLFIEGGRSGGRADASEFLIIVTATSHLATGYTMAAVALATAWSPSDSLGRSGGGWGGGGGEDVAAGSRGETGRQMERRGEEECKMEGRPG